MTEKTKARLVGFALLPLLCVVWPCVLVKDRLVDPFLRFVDDLGTEFLHDRPWEDRP